MRVAILTAILGNFDTPVDPVPQRLPAGVTEIAFHRYTDENFPPITGLMPPLQGRLAKVFGWQMFPGYDVYIWLDGACSFAREDCVEWFLQQLGDHDMVLFRHPTRTTIQQEVEHIEQKLQINHPYIVPRYKNNLHREQLTECLSDAAFTDNVLYASTLFVYRNTPKVQAAFKSWWYYETRYYACDQIALPYVLWKHDIDVHRLDMNHYKSGYVSLVSHHRLRTV
jgi:hypothetical protein